MSDNKLLIGKVAAITGVSRKAIRHYEAIGLLPTPDRIGNYRIYTQHHIVIISMIKRAQAVGFKLAELLPLINLKLETGQFPLDFALQGISDKRQFVQEEITRLKAMDAELIKLSSDLALLASD